MGSPGSARSRGTSHRRECDKTPGTHQQLRQQGKAPDILHQSLFKNAAHLRQWVRNPAFSPKRLSSGGAATGAASVGRRTKLATNVRAASIEDADGSARAWQRECRRNRALPKGDAGGSRSDTKLSKYCDTIQRSCTFWPAIWVRRCLHFVTVKRWQ
jgi:hypothetical protein